MTNINKVPALQLPDFLIIPGVIIADKRLRPLDGQICGVVYWYTHLRLEECSLTDRQIAGLLGVSEGSVSNGICRLHAMKWLSTTYARKEHKRVIALHWRPGSSSFDEVAPNHLMKSPTTPNKEVKRVKENIKEKFEETEESRVILEHWNREHKTNYKTATGFADNLAFWRKAYTMAEIQGAITAVKGDEFWVTRMTPIIFFRRMNPNREQVDHIGTFLNHKPNKKEGNNVDGFDIIGTMRYRTNGGDT